MSRNAAGGGVLVRASSLHLPVTSPLCIVLYKSTANTLGDELRPTETNIAISYNAPLKLAFLFSSPGITRGGRPALKFRDGPAVQQRVHSNIITWNQNALCRKKLRKSSDNNYWFGLFYWAVPKDTMKTKGVSGQVRNSNDTRGVWRSFHKSLVPVWGVSLQCCRDLLWLRQVTAAWVNVTDQCAVRAAATLCWKMVGLVPVWSWPVPSRRRRLWPSCS